MEIFIIRIRNYTFIGYVKCILFLILKISLKKKKKYLFRVLLIYFLSF